MGQRKPQELNQLAGSVIKLGISINSVQMTILKQKLKRERNNGLKEKKKGRMITTKDIK